MITKENRKIVKQVYKECDRSFDDTLAQRAKLAAKLKACAVDGLVSVAIWGRDCDMVESTNSTRIAANVVAFSALDARVYKDSEGPYSLGILTPTQAERFTPSTRDRIAEAWDNGNTTAFIV